VTFDSERLIRDAAWSILGSVTAEQNDELDIAHRYTARLQYGNFFTRTNRTIFQGFVGMAALEEQFVGEEDGRLGIEGLLSLNFELFQFADPEIDLTARGTSYLGLSEWGRIRTDLDLNVSWEIVNDLDLGFRGFLQSDNKPGAEARNIDYGLTTTIGYSWD
jgi:hypothetical protein